MQVDSKSAYAPTRLRSAPWWQIACTAAKNGSVIEDGRFVEGFAELIDTKVVNPYIDAFMAQRRGDPALSGLMGVYYPKIEGLLNWVPLVSQFQLSGKQIFDFGRDLAAEFVSTSLGERKLAGIKLPYRAFYMRFGKQEHAKLPYTGDYEYLDGVFVATTPVATGTRYKFGFATVLKDGEGLEVPGYFVDILPDEAQLPVDEAIRRALERRLKFWSRQVHDSEGEKFLNDARIAAAEEGYALLRDGATLIFNALFALESFDPKNSTPEPGSDTPSKDVERWRQAPSNKKSEVSAYLATYGYPLVWKIGHTS